MNLKIESDYGMFGEYSCELTDKLDDLLGLDKIPKKSRYFKHYLWIDNSLKDNCILIRVPGGTVGNIIINDDDIITDIKIDTNYIVKTYPENVKEQMKKLFIGRKIEGVKK